MLWLLYLWVVHTPNNSPVSDLGILICMFCVCGCVCWQCLLLHLPTTPKEGKSWNDAQSICSSFQGSLVAIEDEIEQGRVLVNCTTMRQWFAAQSLPEKTNSFISTFFFLSCHHFCSLHHHVSPGKRCRCVDWAARWGHHEMDQWEASQLHQLVSSRTKEPSQCKL